MRGIPLQRGIIYGPVRSRRIGRSLGINLLPTERKACALDCVYCQYGRTDVKTLSPQGDLLPSVEEVAAALEEALRRMEDLDVITFSGNGEPTLHPEFGEIVAAALELRDRLAPGKPVGILSSGAMVHLPEVRAALNRLDLQIMKLDAGDDQTFREINRPVAGLGLEGIVQGLQQLDRVILQTLLVKGPRENSSPEKIEKLIRRVRAIRPQEVQLYTLVRPPAEEDVPPVPREELLEIARRIRAETEMVIKVY